MQTRRDPTTAARNAAVLMAARAGDKTAWATSSADTAKPYAPQ
jgi:hypothetical protein